MKKKTKKLKTNEKKDKKNKMKTNDKIKKN